MNKQQLSIHNTKQMRQEQKNNNTLIKQNITTAFSKQH